MVLVPLLPNRPIFSAKHLQRAAVCQYPCFKIFTISNTTNVISRLITNNSEILESLKKLLRPMIFKAISQFHSAPLWGVHSSSPALSPFFPSPHEKKKTPLTKWTTSKTGNMSRPLERPYWLASLS